VDCTSNDLLSLQRFKHHAADSPCNQHWSDGSSEHCIDMQKQSTLHANLGENAPNQCKCSAFHNTTAIVGAGVLGLPFAMKYLTWSGGVIVMCLSWATSLYTLWQVGNCRCE
jgi:Transmembrane amino acid transporter protein